MQQQETFYGQIVGQVIRGRREMQQMNLLTMAQSVALASPSGWSRVETGDTAMTLAQLRKAAKALGMEPSEIVRQADLLTKQLEANGVIVHDDKQKDIGKWLLGGAGILALVAAGAVAAAATKTPKASTAASEDEDQDESQEKSS
jgi:transcriptional regulator with XRE-family HTH domain